jgi:hypothetical protein
MPSSKDNLLDILERNDVKRDARPWGIMTCLGSTHHDLTIKHISIEANARTSLQYHKLKDELLIIIEDYGSGYVALSDVDTSVLYDPNSDALGTDFKDTPVLRCLNCVNSSRLIRIKPGVRHRVVGPMEYIEISTYDDDTDTIRIADDFGRTT